MKTKFYTLLLVLFCLSFIGYAQTTTTITSSGTWDVPAGVTSIQVEAWGGGGGGTGVPTTASRSGGGGSGGCYVKHTTIAVTAGERLTITVGAGGTAGSGSATAATDGGFSSVARTSTTLIKAGGGIKGIYVASPGSTGGVAVTTDNLGFEGSFNYKGGDGATGINGVSPALGTTASGGGAAGSNGNGSGSTPGTGGGAGGAALTVAGNGNPGTAPGGGGGGGANSASGSVRTGGAGGTGQLKITYFSIAVTGSFTPFTAAVGSASTPQTITVVGTSLLNAITVTAPAGFEVSSNGTDYSSSTTIGTSGNSSSTLYLRIAAATGVGTYGGAGVAFVSGATTNSIACSGTVTADSTITASALSSFGSICINATSTANTFTITGVNLTTANVTVGPATGFTFSEDGTTYTSSLSLVQLGGAYSRLIYVKFSPTSVQAFGSIPVGGGGVGSSISVTTTATAINSAVSVASGASNTVGILIANISGTYTIGCSALTAYGIEYSTTSGFADGAGTKAAGSGGATFTASISGLSPATFYYYKVYATDGTGTVYSSQSSFKTKFLEANSTGSFVYTPTGPLSTKPITVYYRIPAGDVSTMPILMAFHGDDRDASNYRDYWTSMANANGFMVFAPEFKETDYPGSDGYQLGNVYVNGDSPSAETLNPTNQWTFSIIDPLFEAIKSEFSGTQLTFKAWGHSGGAQFLQRFNLFMPNSKLDVSVCSNSGWFTVPDISVDFPYGTKNSTLSNSSLAIPFSKKLIVHTGLNDTDPNSSGLRHNTTVDNQQGFNRLDRGRYFFNTSQTISNTLNYTYNWQRQEVAGVGHDAQAMANDALRLLFSTSVNSTINSSIVDGGFENQTTGNLTAVNLLTSAWTTNTTGGGNVRVVNASGGRTGPKYVTFGLSSAGSTAAKYYYSPQLPGAFAANTKYQIQFFYKTASSGVSATTSVNMYVDNSTTTFPGNTNRQSVDAGLGTAAVGSWTKKSYEITTNATTPLTNGLVGLSITIPTANTAYSVDFDDYVVYQGELDNNAPNSPGAITATGATSGGANVSWSVASGGVDGGGYVVVRYATTVPSVSEDPTQNGIYAKGNTIGAGVVRYIGTSNAFTDSGLSPGVDYYYKVYTVDKAFNYSDESVTSTPVQSLVTTYYYKGTGLLTDLASWGQSTDGSGNVPLDFISDSQAFEIGNATSVALDGAWTVSGTGSKVRIGNANQPAITLTLNSGASIGPSGSGNVDVVAPISGNQKLVYKNTTAVSLGNVFDANFEVVYDGVIISSTTTKSFGTVSIINGANITFTANPIIKNINVDASSTLVAPTNASNYITIPDGGSVVIYGTVKAPKLTGFVSSGVTPSSAGADIQFIGTENLTLGANSTVEYARDATTTQIVTARTDYKNLTLSGTVSKTVNGPTTVAGTLTINQTVEATAVTLSGDLTVNGTLSFVSGKITTASNTLTIGTSGTITGADQFTGWVVGNLKKATGSGVSPSYTYAIGDINNYTPLTLTFSGNTSVAGGVTASTDLGDHANIATSGINAAKSVNRTWTLTNDALAGFGTYSAAFVYTSGDNDAGTTPANYGARLYNNGSWSYLITTGTSTTTATAVGVESFGNIAVGEFVGAPAAEPATFCGSATIASLSSSSSATNPKWYAAETGGSVLASDLALASEIYYVSETIDGVESLRTAVVVTVNVTQAPAAESQTFCGSGAVANLIASGTDLKWYIAETGGSDLASNVALVSGNYYVSQIDAITACESLRTSVSVTVNGITTQPSNALICKVIGGSATLSVVAANPGATYQWQTQATAAVLESTWANVANPAAGAAIYSGITGSSLSITRSAVALPPTGTKYRVKVTGSGGCGTEITNAVSITDALLPATPSTLVLTNDAAVLPLTSTTAVTAVGSYAGTNTPFKLTATAAGATSYNWTLPTGVVRTDVSGESTDSSITSTDAFIYVKFTGTGLATPLVIGVQSVNTSGCTSLVKASSSLTRLLPLAPGALAMNDGNTTTAITSFAKYMGTPTVLRLSATAAATANSYLWELPTGVNRMTALTEGAVTTDLTSTDPFIYVNFLGVTLLNTHNSIPTPLTHLLRIGVKSVNGVGNSVTANSGLLNPTSTSTAKLLTLTAVAPAAPTALVLNNGDTFVPATATKPATTKIVPITIISKLIGQGGTYRLSAAVPATTIANRFTWQLPTFVTRVASLTDNTVVEGLDSTNPEIFVRFNGATITNPGPGVIYFGVKAVNDIGSSNSSTANTESSAPGNAGSAFKLLKLATVVPVAPTALVLNNGDTFVPATETKPATTKIVPITIISKLIGQAGTYRLSATVVPATTLANSFTWELPAFVTRVASLTDNTVVEGLDSTNPEIFVRFNGPTNTNPGPGVIYFGVKAVNNVGSSSASVANTATSAPGKEGSAFKLLKLATTVPAVPATLAMNNGALVPTAITAISNLIGQGGTVKLLAATSALANSYSWELPAFVTRVTSMTNTDPIANLDSTDPEIFVRFNGASNTNPLAGFVYFGVKAVNGVGSSNASVANTLALAGEKAGSEFKLLKLATAAPAAPATLVLNELGSTTAVTVVSKYIGTTTPLKLIAGTSVLASSYSWILPSGVNRVDQNGVAVDGLTSTAPFIYVNFYGVANTVATLSAIGVTAVNGVGSSTAKTLTTTVALPVVVATVAGTILGACSTVEYTITAPVGATKYIITGPTGSTVSSANGVAGATANILTTSDLTFTVAYPATLATTNNKLTIRSSNLIGDCLTTKILTITRSSTCKIASDDDVSDEFKVVAHPNPSTEGFTISSNVKSFGVQVYDMLGRSIEQRQMTSESKIGSNYTKGVYNVIVNQGANVKTLRVIKQ